ncbi:MAG TPA: rod shape-determining protein MreC [Bacteroidales bacterium]|nr:rod shape-determining protein MreC [Bacteroidales bacterium]
MRNLIVFLWRHNFFFIFLLLEALALLLVVNNNYYQRRVMVNTTSDISGSLLSTVNEITAYISLKKANQILSEENARLSNKLPSAFMRTDTAQFFVNDSLFRQQYQYVSATVISNSISRRNNYMKINKGRRHGLRPDMAVLAPNGVAGQIIEVSKNYSSVMSMLNSHTRINAKLKNSNQSGSLSWTGHDYRFGKLVDIPSHVSIHIGDTVVTSGYSHIFPEGQMLGTVEEFSPAPGDNFWDVKIHFSVDYNNLQYVYVVKNLIKEELLQLEKKQLTE